MNKVKLKDVCEAMASNIAQKDISVGNGDYPIYGASGFIGNVDFYKQEKPYIGIVKDGAGVGRAYLLPEKSSVIGTMQYILPKDNIDIKYLYYAIQYMHLEKYYSGATIPHIYFRDYQYEPILLPGKKEQEQKTNVLEKIDKLVFKHKKTLRIIDTLVKSRFVEMFGEILDNGIPLAQLAEITGGLTKNSKRNTFPNQMPYLRVANVLFNQLDLSEVLTIGVKDNEIEKTMLCKGDLLFVEGNGSVEQIGRVAVWDGSIEPCLHQNHLIKARFNSRKINPVYALFYFMSQKGRAQIVRRAVSTSGLHTLSVGKIESLELPVPPIKKQNQFADFVALTDKSKHAVQQSIETLQTLKAKLMQDYFG